jgi:C4-dicarboxylate transporter/malic acid transport protein
LELRALFQEETIAMFKKIVKNFGPEWGAAVMGTAAICITMQLSSEVARPFSILLYVGVGFYLLATAMFIAFLIPWSLRFFMYPEEIKKDLQNPIRGNFFPTMPICFILAGTGTNKLGPILFGPWLAYHLSIVFFFLGVIGIFTFGFILVRTQFLNKEIRQNHANFSWFIPPVSHLIIPVLGACSMDVYWAETSLASTLFIISMIALGVGFFNFLFVGSAVWHRYIYADIPQGRLAPTTMVGIAPTAIIVIFLMKFVQAVEASHGNLFGISFMSIFPIIKIISFALWGFSLWWLILVAVLLHAYIKMNDHPFVFGWWAYTFPFEAFVVATGLLSQIAATHFLQPFLVILNAAAVIVWIIVVYGTIRWLESGEFFAPQH